jgi:hypothetical protein
MIPAFSNAGLKAVQLLAMASLLLKPVCKKTWLETSTQIGPR